MSSIKINFEVFRKDEILCIFLSIILITNFIGHLGANVPLAAQVKGGEVVSIVQDASNLDDQSYQPNPVNIRVGDTVTWTNDDSARHTVTELNSSDPNNTSIEQNRDEKGFVEGIINEIVTNIVYNLRNVLGNTEIEHLNTNDNSQSFSSTPDQNFDSGIMETGQTFSYTFNEAGTYEYYCTVHPGMTAQVIVSQ